MTAYHANYFAHELTKRCPSDSVGKLAASLADAQVDLNPHQINAALFAFRPPLSKGAILAEEVGRGELINLTGTFGLGDRECRIKDIRGRVYEYFPTQFASAEGKNGGQFYTPSCVVLCLVEMLARYKGRIYDPACGSDTALRDSKFLQSEAKMQVVSEAKDNFRKDDDVRWQFGVPPRRSRLVNLTLSP